MVGKHYSNRIVAEEEGRFVRLEDIQAGAREFVDRLQAGKGQSSRGERRQQSNLCRSERQEGWDVKLGGEGKLRGGGGGKESGRRVMSGKSWLTVCRVGNMLIVARSTRTTMKLSISLPVMRARGGGCRVRSGDFGQPGQQSKFRKRWIQVVKLEKGKVNNQGRDTANPPKIGRKKN